MTNLLYQGLALSRRARGTGTTTKDDGTFLIEVSNPDATLVFSFIGMIPQEFSLKGRKQILIKAKFDCTKDFFDSQHIMLYANSGVINNPVGGQIDVASPWVLGGLVKGMYSYQTNLDENQLQMGHVELMHYISNCDFDIDFRWSYKEVSFNNDLNFHANSFETDFNFRNIKLIAGYSRLDFNRPEINQSETFSGAVIGIGTALRMTLHPTAIAKFSIYKNKIEYQAEIEGRYKRFVCFVKFYKLDSLTELSLGVGGWIGY
jgi:hypothetical protein